jgi:hypothetical protein
LRASPPVKLRGREPTQAEVSGTGAAPEEAPLVVEDAEAQRSSASARSITTPVRSPGYGCWE